MFDEIFALEGDGGSVILSEVEKLVGIYFSGTGNTRHCTQKLLSMLDSNAEYIALENDDAEQAIRNNDFVIYAYPTQYSNAPIFVRDYIEMHPALWNGKKIFCLNTMGLFSGDGTGCTARIFKKYGAEVVGGLQIRMPDSVCDSNCIGCGLCVGDCPTKNIKMAEGKEVVSRSTLRFVDCDCFSPCYT